MVIQIHEAQRILNRINPKKTTPRHIIIHLSNDKDKKKILTAAREKQLVIYKEIPHKILVDFSAETLQARKEWNNIFKFLKEKKTCQPRIL